MVEAYKHFETIVFIFHRTVNSPELRRTSTGLDNVCHSDILQ